MTFDPIPSICAPIFTSRRARSWTCGSHAALPIVVGPGGSAAAISAFSVPITDGSSMKIAHGFSPPSGARISIARSPSTVAPRSAKASRCGSRRRRPMKSPPGGGMDASPKRASNGPASRNEARIRAESDSSGLVSETASACRRRASSVQSALTPSCSSTATWVSVSRIRGTLVSTTSSSVSRQAARIGRAAFLLPAAVISPARGGPPLITNFSIGAEGNNALMSQPTRDEAWDLVCEWIQSDSLRKHLLGVEAAMVAYGRERGGDEELWAVTGLVHDLDYERFPDLDDAENGHPRTALRLFAELGWPQEVIDAVAGHATFLGVPRETDLAKTLFAVDELSGFVAACALVRPTGIEGMAPKSVKKKLKQPSFAAGVNREEVRRGAEELGVDFDEHVAFVIEAMAEQADELGLTPREDVDADSG